MLEPEFIEQAFESFFLPCFCQGCKFKDGTNVIFHAQFPENGRFLRQVTDSALCAAEHGLFRDIEVIQVDGSGKGLDQSDDDIKGSGFTGAVWSEQSDDLSLLYLDGNFIHNR